MTRVTAIAHPNIALVKYWGKRDLPLNLPAVPSVSLTLDGYQTETTVSWGTQADRVTVDGVERQDGFARRALGFLNRIDPSRPPVHIDTTNNFPAGAGLASSSSGFAALALAASRAAGQDLSIEALSALARQGSGSASRSLWGGFVEWSMGSRADGQDSHGYPIAPQDHWDVRMVVGVVHSGQKKVGSTSGMGQTRDTSAYWQQWVDTAIADVQEARAAILAKDLPRLGEVMEQSTFKMHATMHTTRPPLIYWQPGTVGCLHAIFELREQGVGAWVTMDAGPQVKVLCEPSDAERVAAALAPHTERVDILAPGGPAVVR